MPLALFIVVLCTGALANDYSAIEVAIYAGYGLISIPPLMVGLMFR